ncbi:ABC transporter ATP-binding protein [uncultured Albimonas sp.]|uniref:ABC transporter ATP-binding protein n=1 Tax=uncultured Albimonas sp. TaxID=1331701 RepID=UPI0030EB881B
MLELREVCKRFPLGGGLLRRGGEVRALDGIDLSVAPGETVALVGESGSGKTTAANLALGLEPPSSGEVRWRGRSLGAMTRTERRAFRREVTAVFQDPYSSLNPRMRVRDIVAEPLRAHRALSGADLRRRVEETLDVVGLPAEAAGLYAHEFSGGQRQRIAIARALALRPQMMVLDEPTSALDVSIRAQIVNLLMDIQAEFGLGYLLIAHDLALVEHFADRVAVIYLGRLVEQGDCARVFGAPAHPYTRTLLAAAPRAEPGYTIPETVDFGEIGSAARPPSGCRFHPRCPHAEPICAAQAPPDAALPGGGRALCHFAGRLPDRDPLAGPSPAGRNPAAFADPPNPESR